MLRKLNIELAERKVPRATYVEWVRETIVKEVLAQRPHKVPATVPPRRRAAVDAIAESWIEEIDGRGIDVVGDLSELRPVWPQNAGPWADPDRADPELVAEAAIESLAHVLAQAGLPRAEVGTLARRLGRRLRA